MSITLPELKVASPCNVSWDSMTGDSRTRFCDHCEKNVYNLSDLSRQAVADLIVEKEGHLCVTFYRRFDGKVMTNDCPVGLRAIRRNYLKARAKTIAAFAAILATVGISSCQQPSVMGDLVAPPIDSTAKKGSIAPLKPVETPLPR